MSRRKFRVEEIINMLRQAEVLLSQGQSALHACRNWVLASKLTIVGGGNMVAFASIRPNG